MRKPEPSQKSEPGRKPEPARKPELRETLSAAVFIAVIGILFILNLVVPAPNILVSERRVPAKLPEFNMKTVASASFMKNFEDYAADRFVFRDGFRAIHAFTVFDIFRQSDKSGLYRSAAVGVGEFLRTDVKSFRQTAEKIDKAAKALDDMGIGLDIHYSIVPDKSIYAGTYMPGFDLHAAETVLSDVLGGYEYIPISDTLYAGSFYKTDLHWSQTEITAALYNRLLRAMRGFPGAADASAADASITDADATDDSADAADSSVTGTSSPSPSLTWFESVSVGEFRGVYAGQIALPVKPDTMKYYDLPGIEASYLSETTLEFEDGPVYDPERFFTGVDPYDFFLRGPQPLIVLERTQAELDDKPAAAAASAGDRELYLFRDSFGSSLAPMLIRAGAGGYDRITLIDLRYLNFALLGQFVDFTPNSDVLFLYSSQIFNNPSVLQV